MLLAVDNDSDYPADIVSKLPRVGRDLEINIDEVKALKPDLVLASLTVPGHEKIIEGLDAAQLDYLAPEPVSLDDVYDNIREIAAALNVSSRGEQVVNDMQNVITSQTLSASSIALPDILIQWWPKPIIAPGQFSWVNALLESAGANNPLFHKKVKSLPVEDKVISEINPDAIVISWCGVKTEKYRPEVIYRNPEFSEVKAIKNKKVFCVSEAYLGRPSPRLVDGYRALREIVENLRDI